jgi:hypothetical protein
MPVTTLPLLICQNSVVILKTPPVVTTLPLLNPTAQTEKTKAISLFLKIATGKMWAVSGKHCNCLFYICWMMFKFSGSLLEKSSKCLL